MGTTLYLLRQQPERLSASLFQASDADIDIVFVEQAIETPSASVKGAIVATHKIVEGSSYPTMSYDDLVEKIFSSKHIIVL